MSFRRTIIRKCSTIFRIYHYVVDFDFVCLFVCFFVVVFLI